LYNKDIYISRRRFLVSSAAGLALAGLPEWFAKEALAQEQERAADMPRTIGPNDEIVFGAIGLGGSKGGYRQGLGITKAARNQKGTRIVAVCDVDAQHREEAAKEFGPDTGQYFDYRELLARPDIDAVTIGAPDHWHAVMAVDAMRAGKDVYCEKPLTLTIDEGKKLVQVAKETGRVFQTGSQQRSDRRFRLACELVRNDRIGKIKRVEAHLPGAPSGGPFEVKPIPPDLDWNRWLGPAPYTDYVPQRTHGTFRWWFEYSGGMVTDWGAHHNDIAQWGLGMDRSGPVRVESVGTAPPPAPNAYNVFRQFDITYTYPNGVTLLCTNKGENGVRFEGEDGWIFVSRGKIEAGDPKLLEEPLPPNATRLYVSDSHMGNFVDCVRSRQQPICDAEIGHRSVSVCHLGNISLRLGGRKLEWDPEREQFKNDSEADAMLGRIMRRPWSL
jgi:predicted dehydrogenase